MKSLPVFKTSEFEFAGEPPSHTDDLPVFYNPRPGTFTVVVGQNSETHTVVAYWVPTYEVAKLLAHAYQRKHFDDLPDVWIIDPSGNKTPALPYTAVLDALGPDVEQRMVTVAQGLDSLVGVTLSDLAGVPRKS